MGARENTLALNLAVNAPDQQRCPRTMYPPGVFADRSGPGAPSKLSHQSHPIGGAQNDAISRVYKARSQGSEYGSHRKLLDHAIKRGVLRDEGYPGLAQRRANTAALSEQAAEYFGRAPTSEQQGSYVRMMAKATSKLRNAEAHPWFQMIVPPGMALDSLNVAVETIHQLWPRADPSA